MRALVQRVASARVRTRDGEVGAIGPGLLALVAAGRGDDAATARSLADRIARLRVFPGDDGRMRLDVAAAGGAVLVVSQFTLYGDLRKGTRPSFTAAAEPERAEALVDEVAHALRGCGLAVAEGRFGAAMTIDATLDGPVTIWIDADDGRT